MNGEAPMPSAAGPPRRPAHIIVVGNEKGGSGKTTLAMHIAVALLGLGRRVACIDLDSRQQSLARYITNRARTIERLSAALTLPDVIAIERSSREARSLADGEERVRLERALSGHLVQADFVIIDCPGNDTYLARTAHALADTLLTPINDSFVDFDLLAQVSPDTFKVERPSLYAEMVWESRKRRMSAARRSIDWIIVRNRLSPLDTKNKRRVSDALEELKDRIGFRVGPGISERVIYREMFPLGLTLFDAAGGGKGSLTMSHVAARNEMRELVRALRLGGIALDDPSTSGPAIALAATAFEGDAAAE